MAAVPHDVLCWECCPAAMGEEGGMLAGLQHIRTSPITGVHLWFDRVVMKEPFLALLDHTTQWIFNKSLLYAHAATNGDGPVQRKASIFSW